MPFGIAFESPPGVLDGHALADTGEDVLQIALAGFGVKRIVGGEQGQPAPSCDVLELRQPPPVVAAPRHAGAEPERAGRGLRQARQCGFETPEFARRHDDQNS
jgi:hypothetical protein